MRPRRPEIERFMEKVMPVTETGCWLWIGCLINTGYGTLSMRGKLKMMLAHRWSYEHFKGPIPEGMTIDHKCRVRSCVNPDHLRILSMKDNVLAGLNPPALNARKTHCKRGHEFTPDNTYHPNGNPKWRGCKKCNRQKPLAEQSF